MAESDQFWTLSSLFMEINSRRRAPPILAATSPPLFLNNLDISHLRSPYVIFQVLLERLSVKVVKKVFQSMSASTGSYSLGTNREARLAPPEMRCRAK